jgi:hypothetical protein
VSKLDRWLMPIIGLSLLIVAFTGQAIWLLLALAASGVYLMIRRQ